jgi:hypothetical protein
MCGFWKYFFALLIAFISWPAHSTPFAEASIDDLRMWIERDATKYWGPENAVDDGWISIGGSGRHYLIGEMFRVRIFLPAPVMARIIRY